MLPHPKEEDPANLPRTWIQSHYASFNGLRALAVMLVFLHHAGGYVINKRLASGLWIGVELFFVLSGFLITGILYDSIRDPHFFRNFYVRRALRIFPIFYGFFLLVLILTPILHLTYEPTLFSFALYLGNLVTPWIDIANHNPTIISAALHGKIFHMNIGHLWSLCVEEQFYLIWPPVVWLVRSRVTLMRICIGVGLFTLLERLALWHFTSHLFFVKNVYWSPYTRFDTLLAGAFLALWLRGQPLSRTRLRRISAALFLIPAGFITICTLLRPRQGFEATSGFMGTIGYTLIALASAGVVLRSLDHTSYLSRFLQLRVIAAFGAISYGFYFIHALMLPGLQDLLDYNILPSRFSWTVPFIAFGVTLALARLSFTYYESPLLRLKSRFAPQWVPKDEAELPVSLHLSEPRPS